MQKEENLQLGNRSGCTEERKDQQFSGETKIGKEDENLIETKDDSI